MPKYYSNNEGNPPLNNGAHFYHNWRAVPHHPGYINSPGVANHPYSHLDKASMEKETEES